MKKENSSLHFMTKCAFEDKNKQFNSALKLGVKRKIVIDDFRIYTKLIPLLMECILFVKIHQIKLRLIKRTRQEHL